jgi:hypothetical protein
LPVSAAKFPTDPLPLSKQNKKDIDKVARFYILRLGWLSNDGVGRITPEKEK